VFGKQEGRGRAGSRRTPDRIWSEGRGRGYHRMDDEEADPRVGPGRWGHRGPGGGRAHGFGRMGWIPRAFFAPGRGPAVRRGDVRAAILVLLAEEPMHGYQIIGQLGERSGGMWRPSAGSVYPTLQQLEDEGLVRAEEKDNRKVYALTEDGRKAAAEAARDRAPWDITGADETMSLWALFRPLAAAVAQVSQVGSPETIDKARAILLDSRRQLYRLLAEDDQPDQADRTDRT
jgi:DNA-binding PadR family transcriptional regulator